MTGPGRVSFFAGVLEAMTEEEIIERAQAEFAEADEEDEEEAVVGFPVRRVTPVAALEAAIDLANFFEGMPPIEGFTSAYNISVLNQVQGLCELLAAHAERSKTQAKMSDYFAVVPADAAMNGQGSDADVPGPSGK